MLGSEQLEAPVGRNQPPAAAEEEVEVCLHEKDGILEMRTAEFRTTTIKEERAADTDDTAQQGENVKTKVEGDSAVPKV